VPDVVEVRQSNRAKAWERQRQRATSFDAINRVALVTALAVLAISCVFNAAAQASPGGFSPRPEAATEEAPTGEGPSLLWSAKRRSRRQALRQWSSR
jgi:hypothetical protein